MNSDEFVQWVRMFKPTFDNIVKKMIEHDVGFKKSKLPLNFYKVKSIKVNKQLECEYTFVLKTSIQNIIDEETSGN